MVPLSMALLPAPNLMIVERWPGRDMEIEGANFHEVPPPGTESTTSLEFFARLRFNADEINWLFHGVGLWGQSEETG